MNKNTPHVIIIGGGFAGLWAARALAKTAVNITLIDRENHHLFQPLLYQVATAGLSSPDIAAPLRHILRDQKNVTVRLAEATAIDANAKTILLNEGEKSESIAFDYLLVASGSTHAYFGNDHWAAHAPGLKTLNDALSIRRRLLMAFENAEAAASDEEREAWLNFAVVGGGPTGVELAGTLAEIARHTLAKEFRNFNPHDAKVRLIEAGSRVLPSFPDSLTDKAKASLEKLGVEVLCGKPVTDIQALGYTRDGTFTPCHTVLWAAGVAASPLGKMLGAPTDRAGRVLVSPDLSIPNHPDVFVGGDLASVTQDGKSVPGVAPAAKQMGNHIARAIIDRIAGKTSTAFIHKDYGNMATIGRMSAVVDLKGFKLSGALAWWFWLAAHIFFLIGFRNRLAVLINWGSAYLTFQRHARIILRRDNHHEI